MKNTVTHRLIAALAISGISLFSISAIAGQDEVQRLMTQRVMQAKQKLQQAEAAKGAERQKLMGEHMKMMQETMEKMQAMKPRVGMSMQEHESWMNEHQKLMDDMMGQMMEEHHMMMGMDCMAKDDSHKH